MSNHSRNVDGDNARVAAPQPTVIPHMIELARESRGLSQTELAEALAVTQGKVSKMEAGIIGVSDADMDRLCKVLEYPREFFLQPDALHGFGTTCMYHRKRQCLPVKELRVIHATINVIRLQLVRLLKSVTIENKNCFYRLDADEHESPEAIARMVRASWELPIGPIKNLVAAIEYAGGIVVQCDFGTDKIDAVSQWPRNAPPLFFVNKNIPTDRWRFSLAHELGHLIMHAVPTENAEKEADRFASEFLMPEREIIDGLDRMNLAKAAQMKLHWRVSMQALIRRARDLERITENQYRYLCTQISKEGYRTNEPEPIPPEQPSVVPDLITTYQQHYGYTIAQLSAMVHSHEDHFRMLLMNEEQPRLKLHSG